MTVQGTFYYPGITGVLSCSVTFSLGISPSVTQVSIPPTPGIQKRGTAVWSYGGTVRVMPRSMVGPIQVSRSGGKVVWSVSILDRRAAWTTGQISGEYNVRNGDAVIESTAKNPRELATLCLQAMEETQYDVSALPTNDQPYVNWQVEVPAKALADVCELYGCAVSLQRDNSVKIVKLGTGNDLPTGWLTRDESIDPGDVPKALACLTAPTQWQVDLELEPVGAEYDPDNPDEIGEIKPIDDLSYAPEGGWGEQSDYLDFDAITDDKTRKIAAATVWKWYRVKYSEITVGILEEAGLPGAVVEYDDINQVLPLVDGQVETEGVGDNRKPKSPAVWGKFRDGHELMANNTSEIEVGEYSEELLVTNESFSVDVSTGVVKFGGPMIRDGDPDGLFERTVEPAILKLRCAVNLRDKDTRAPQRQFKQIPLDPSAPTLPKYVTREDIVPQYYVKDGQWVNNAEEVESQVDFYLNQEMANFRTQPGATADYAGFIPVDNDGALLQITYSIDGEGKATTKISRNLEQIKAGLTFKEARQRQKLWAVVQRESRQRQRLLNPPEAKATP
jgi:hypothetical protein